MIHEMIPFKINLIVWAFNINHTWVCTFRNQTMHDRNTYGKIWKGCVALAVTADLYSLHPYPTHGRNLTACHPLRAMYKRTCKQLIAAPRSRIGCGVLRPAAAYPKGVPAVRQRRFRPAASLLLGLRSRLPLGWFVT